MQTWEIRLERLVELGFIEVKKDQLTMKSYALLLDPVQIPGIHFVHCTFGLRADNYSAPVA
jgi:hypothetical protein